MKETKKKPAGGEFRLALNALRAFAGAYTLLIFLAMFFLPQKEPWRTIWMAGGMAMGLLAAAVVFFAWIAALRRRSPALEDFKEFLREMKTPGHILLFVWLAWTCAACLLVAREGMTSLRHNSSYLFDLAVSALVLFPLGYYFGRRRDLGLLHLVLDAGIGLYAVLMVYALVRMFRTDTIYFVALFGRAYGFQLNRLYLGTNPNTTGAYCTFFMMACVYRALSAKKWPVKGIFGALAALYFYGMFRAISRANIIAGLAGLALLGLLYLARRLKIQRSAPVRTVWILVGLAALVTVALFLREGTEAAPVKAAVALLVRIFGHGDRAATAFTLAGRVPLWNTIVAAIWSDRHWLLHGVSPAEVVQRVSDIYGKAWYTHNQFLEILAGQGLPAAALFTVWLGWLGDRGYRLQLDPGTRTGAWALPLLPAVLILSNLAEAMLVCLQHYTGSLFFLAAGFAAGLAAAGDNRH